jgi:hypothetical protein
LIFDSAEHTVVVNKRHDESIGASKYLRRRSYFGTSSSLRLFIPLHIDCGEKKA